MNRDRALVLILFIALIFQGLQTISLSAENQVLKKKVGMFPDQIYDTFVSGCDAGANQVQENVYTNMPAPYGIVEICTLNAKSAKINFENYLKSNQVRE